MLINYFINLCHISIILLVYANQWFYCFLQINHFIGLNKSINPFSMIALLLHWFQLFLTNLKLFVCNNKKTCTISNLLWLYPTFRTPFTGIRHIKGDKNYYILLLAIIMWRIIKINWISSTQCKYVYTIWFI